MNLHLDHQFEHEICTHPSAGAGLYAGGNPAPHDRQLGSFRCALGKSNAGVSEA